MMCLFQGFKRDMVWKGCVASRDTALGILVVLFQGDQERATGIEGAGIALDENATVAWERKGEVQVAVCSKNIIVLVRLKWVDRETLVVHLYVLSSSFMMVSGYSKCNSTNNILVLVGDLCASVCWTQGIIYGRCYRKAWLECVGEKKIFFLLCCYLVFNHDYMILKEESPSRDLDASSKNN